MVVREVVVRVSPYLDVLLFVLPKPKSDDFVEVSETLPFAVVGNKAEIALFVLDFGVVVVVVFFFSKKRLIASITS